MHIHSRYTSKCLFFHTDGLNSLPLTGHHFFQVGMGMGEWNPDKDITSDYNLVDPILRDTVTVLFNGTTEDKAAWVAFRYCMAAVKHCMLCSGLPCGPKFGCLCQMLWP